MRRPSRLLAFSALVVVAVTCTDAPTGPKPAAVGSSGAHLSLSPSFSPSATTAFNTLAAFALDVSSVRIVLTAADGKVVKDTTIDFPTSQVQLSIDLRVPISGAEQTFSALVQLRDALSRVLFSGTQQVIARAAGLPGATPPPPVVLNYVGPGASVRTVRLTPSDASIAASSGVTINASAMDSSGAVVNSPFSFRVSDAALATLVPEGANGVTVTGTGRRGTVTVTAVTPTGIAGTARVVLIPPAASLAVVSGSGQSDSVGRALPLPLVVRALDATGAPVPGVTVSWAVVSGTGRISASSSVTGADGTASTNYTLGSRPGAESVTATVASVSTPATFAFTVKNLAASQIAATGGSGQSDQVGRALSPMSVRVTDSQGSAVPNVVVQWSADNGAVPTPAQSTTDGDGRTSTIVTLGTHVGPVLVSASIAGRTATFTATTLAGPPTRLFAISGVGQSAQVGGTVAFAPGMGVQDAFSNPVILGSVVFAVASGGGTITSASTTTRSTSLSVPLDPSGAARLTGWTLGSVAGPNTVTATIGSLSQTVTATATSGAPSRLAVVQALPASITVGVPLTSALRVQVTDTLGNTVRVGGIAVTATSTIAGLVASSIVLAATTDTTGLASFTLPVYSGTAGVATIVLTAPGFTSITLPPLTILPGAATRIGIVSVPASATNGVALSPAPTVRLVDVGGNFVTQVGVSITAAVASGTTMRGPTTATTDATGQATFSGLNFFGSVGNYALSFTGPGLASVTSPSIAVGPGIAASAFLASGNSQSGPVSAAVAQLPTIVVRDSNLNPVSGVAVTFAVASGGGSVAGGSTTTNASGLASPSSWTLGSTAGANTLTTTTQPALTGSPLTFSATATAGAATQLYVQTPQPTSGTIAAPLNTFTIGLKDGSGNIVANSGVTIAAAIASGPGGTLSGTTSAVTNAQGLALFNNLTVTGLIGSYSFSFTAAGYTTATSSSVTLQTGSAAALSITTQPSLSVVSGSSFSTQPVVRVIDQGGNTVTSATGTMSVTAAGFTPSPSSAAISSGVTTFSGLSLSGTAGSTALVFSDGTRSTTSITVTVTAPPATQMQKNTGDAQSANAGTVVPVAPSVLVKDSFGTGVSGVVVTFAVASGGGSITGASATTNASGIATVGSWTLGNTPGSNSLSAATSPALTGSPLTFSATGTLGPVATITVSPAFLSVAHDATQTYTAVGKDAVGNVVAITPIWSVTAGGGTIGSTSGVFTAGSTLGNFANSIRATSGTVFGTASVIVTNTSVTAAASGAWATAATWTGGVIPVNGDTVTIPAVVNVTDNVSRSVANLTLALYGTLTNSTAGLSITGTLTDQYQGLSVPSISFSNSATPLSATTGIINANSVTFNSAATLGTNLTVNGTLFINSSSATLTLAGHTVNATNFQSQVGARLIMTNALDSLKVGNATFAGGSTAGTLTKGTLIVSGNFAQNTTSDAFVPSGTFKTVLTGRGSSITFLHPTNSWFNNLDVDRGAQRTLSSDVLVKGTLAQSLGAADTTTREFSGAVNIMTVSGLNWGTDPTLFTGVKLRFVDGVANTTFNKASFSGFGAMNASIFDVVRSDASLTFNNLSFSGSLGTSGRYLAVSGSTVVTMVVPNPSSTAAPTVCGCATWYSGNVTWP